MFSSLAQLQSNLRAALTSLSSYSSGTGLTAAAGAAGGIGANNISLSGGNLSGHTATNLANRAGGNLSVNLSSPAGLPAGGALAPGQPVVVAPPTLPSPGTEAVANSNITARLGAIQQQVSQLMAQLDDLNASFPGLMSGVTNSTPIERGQQLTPTGRTPPENNRPQPPRNLRLVR